MKRVRNIPLGGSGSGSDVEMAGSGGEMSESGKTKKLKLNPPGTSRGGTPVGSRAGSPIAGGRSFSGSRASSPDGGKGKSHFHFPHYLYFTLL